MGRRKNEGLMPENIPAGGHKKAWRRCKSGHSWKSEIRTRALGTECPCCVIPVFQQCCCQRSGVSIFAGTAVDK